MDQDVNFSIVVSGFRAYFVISVIEDQGFRV